ncbi:ATP-binding cassette domain-containing protein [Serratia symbiotica]|uniref:ATP-binding cassette domain-containing protein n=1 Tax=Serratia symbiotica TaxID=138074 RepID=UPI0018C8CD8F|nr:ATP-binding cassette domain-containing protein [Serratia symbiotica]
MLPFAVLGLGISLPIGTLSSSAQSLQMAKGAFNRLAELLAIPQQMEPQKVMINAGNNVCLERVSFSYGGDRRIINDISLTLEPGSVTALVGASGAGKSTQRAAQTPQDKTRHSCWPVSRASRNNGIP